MQNLWRLGGASPIDRPHGGHGRIAPPLDPPMGHPKHVVGRWWTPNAETQLVDNLCMQQLIKITAHIRIISSPGFSLVWRLFSFCAAEFVQTWWYVRHTYAYIIIDVQSRSAFGFHASDCRKAVSHKQVVVNGNSILTALSDISEYSREHAVQQ